MAEFNYAKSQKTADKLITKFGGKMAGKIIREVRTGGTDIWPETTSSEIPCSCVAVDYSIRERQVMNVKEGAKRIMVSCIGLPSGFQLSTGDIIRTRDGLDFTIVPPASAFTPTNITIFYDVQGVR